MTMLVKISSTDRYGLYISIITTQWLGYVDKIDNSTFVLQVDANVAGQYASALAPYVLHVWAHHSNDPQLAEDVKDIIKAFCQSPQVLLFPSLCPLPPPSPLVLIKLINFLGTRRSLSIFTSHSFRRPSIARSPVEYGRSSC